MKKYITVTICLLTLFGMSLSAQNKSHFGLYFGLGANNMDLDNAFYYDDSKIYLKPDGTSYYMEVSNTSAKANAELIFGGFYEYDMNSFVNLQCDLLYCQYGYQIDGILAFGGYPLRCAAVTHMHNINLALMMKFLPVKFMSVDLGIQPSYCWKMVKETNRAGGDRVRHVYDGREEYNPLNFSAKGGLTFYFKSLFLSVDYVLGLVDVLKVKTPIMDMETGAVEYKYTGATSKTNSIQITIGFRII